MVKWCTWFHFTIVDYYMLQVDRFLSYKDIRRKAFFTLATLLMLLLENVKFRRRFKWNTPKTTLMSISLALFLMKELNFMALLLPGVQMGLSLKMVDWLHLCLVLFLLKVHSPMFNVEMVICVGETPVDREYAVSKI